MSTIIYNFNDTDFEYEIELNDFIKIISKEQILEFVHEIGSKLSDEKKIQVISTWEDINEKDFDFSMLTDFISEHEDEFIEWFEDDILAHFEDEAFEYYKDARDYERDPYAYFGVSRTDFI